MKRTYVGKPEDLLKGEALESVKDWEQVRVMLIQLDPPSPPTVKPHRKLIISRKGDGV